MGGRVATAEECESPRTALRRLLTALEKQPDEEVKKLCTQKGWDSIEVDRFLQSEAGFTKQMFRGHFRVVNDLKDEKFTWRMFGKNYCVASTREEDASCDSFLFLLVDGKWKLQMWSPDGPARPLDENIKE